jgi:hypothetical protein
MLLSMGTLQSSLIMSGFGKGTAYVGVFKAILGFAVTHGDDSTRHPSYPNFGFFVCTLPLKQGLRGLGKYV